MDSLKQCHRVLVHAVKEVKYHYGTSDEDKSPAYFTVQSRGTSPAFCKPCSILHSETYQNHDKILQDNLG